MGKLTQILISKAGGELVWLLHSSLLLLCASSLGLELRKGEDGTSTTISEVAHRLQASWGPSSTLCLQRPQISPLEGLLVLAFGALPLACSWTQNGASRMSLKSHLNHFGGCWRGWTEQL